MASTRALRPSLGSLLQQCTRPTTTSSSSSSPLLLLRQQQPPNPQLPSSSRPFTTTPSAPKRHTYIGARKTRDANKNRGESTVRRTGTRWRLSVSDDPLPRPVPQAEIPVVETDPNHGLWDFFHEKDRIVLPPTEIAEHGRAWTVQELRGKSWDDLHGLWWVCCKERNRISTMAWEREKAKLGSGDSEDGGRHAEIKETMRNIRHVLTERFYAWEDARKLAETDPEINLAGGGKNGPVFTPREYFEEEVVDVEEEEVDVELEKSDSITEKGEVKLNVDPSALPAAGEAKEAPRV